MKILYDPDDWDISMHPVPVQPLANSLLWICKAKLACIFFIDQQAVDGIQAALANSVRSLRTE